jgi:ubiquinone/menaquinone biosynthesis C-methylase UbiE
MIDEQKIAGSVTTKSCCTLFYESDMLTNVLGERLHPGGGKLTHHLGEKLELNPNSEVLDVACGNGISAITLARLFWCKVTGLDLSKRNLRKALKKAQEAGFQDKVKFVRGDAEKILFEDNRFDALISECSLCTFPDKKSAVSEMYRVLKKRGKVGITDIVIDGALPTELNNILSHVLCISGALSSDSYQELLHEAGFSSILYENHSCTMQKVLKKGYRLLMGWRMVEKLFDFNLEKLFGITREDAKELLKVAIHEVENGTIGYGLFVGVK